MDPKSAFEKFLKENNIGINDRILVAVSGGLDSMCLLHLFITHNYSCAAAHVNYKLRGQDSELDEKLVKSFCESNSIPFYKKSIDLSSDSASRSIQDLASKERYHWFNELCEQEDFKWIATAHHLNDQAETFLMKLFRKSGIEGLSGIWPVKNNIIRPLLKISKEELKQYAESHNINWREDESNKDSSKYLRNKIRNELMPMLNDFDSESISKMGRTSELLRDDYQLLNAFLDSEIQQAAQSNQKIFFFPKERLLKHKHDSFLYHLGNHFGLEAGECLEFNVALNESMNYSASTKKWYLSLENSGLWILKADLKLQQKKIEEEGLFEFPPGNLKIIEIEFTQDSLKNASSSIAFLPHEKYIIRVFEPGDKIQLFGNRANKKIGDIFTDQHVPVCLRKLHPIICREDGEIMCIPGIKSSEKTRLEEGQKAFRIEWYPYFAYY